MKQQTQPTKKRTSRYQRKLARRQAEARRLGLPASTTWPEIWFVQSQQKARDE